MDTPVSKEQIQNALTAFADGNLRDNARRLFETLGYRSEKRIDLLPNTAETFLEEFDREKKLNKETAMLDHWRSVDLLFQLTSDEINQTKRVRAVHLSRSESHCLFVLFVLLYRTWR